MLEFVHCNKCFRDDAVGAVTYWLTECGHVLCHSCLETSGQKQALSGEAALPPSPSATSARAVCPVCQANCHCIRLSEKEQELPALIQPFFKSTQSLFDDTADALKFQIDNMTGYLKYLKGKVTRQRNVLLKVKHELVNIKALKSDNNTLRSENTRLLAKVQELERSLGQQSSRPGQNGEHNGSRREMVTKPQAQPSTNSGGGQPFLFRVQQNGLTKTGNASHIQPQKPQPVQPPIQPPTQPAPVPEMKAFSLQQNEHGAPEGLRPRAQSIKSWSVASGSLPRTPNPPARLSLPPAHQGTDSMSPRVVLQEAPPHDARLLLQQPYDPNQQYQSAQNHQVAMPPLSHPPHPQVPSFPQPQPQQQPQYQFTPHHHQQQEAGLGHRIASTNMMPPPPPRTPQASIVRPTGVVGGGGVLTPVNSNMITRKRPMGAEHLVPIPPAHPPSSLPLFPTAQTFQLPKNHLNGNAPLSASSLGGGEGRVGIGSVGGRLIETSGIRNNNLGSQPQPPRMTNTIGTIGGPSSERVTWQQQQQQQQLRQFQQHQQQQQIQQYQQQPPPSQQPRHHLEQQPRPMFGVATAPTNGIAQQHPQQPRQQHQYIGLAPTPSAMSVGARARAFSITTGGPPPP